MKPRKDTIHLQLGSANLMDVQLAIGTLMEGLDRIKPGVRAAALCVGFLALCEREGIDTLSVVTATKKMMMAAKDLKGYSDFDAIAMFLKEEKI